MHRCWEIGEIVIGIVEVCQPEKTGRYTAHDKEGLRTLCSLARTCRSLERYALDALWYRQHSLAPLVKCLPDDLWVLDDAQASRRSGPMVNPFSTAASTTKQLVGLFASSFPYESCSHSHADSL